MAVLVDPETLTRISAIQKEAEGRWSRGRILDRAMDIAANELMQEAFGRQVIIITMSPQTERNLRLAPLA